MGTSPRLVTLEGVSSPHRVMLPAEHSSARPWPVILFLHGAGERGEDGVRPTRVGLGPAVRAHPERFPAVVVYPQVPADSVWRAGPAVAALAALDAAVMQLHGDPRRLYLVGLSMGGYGAWELALRHPTRFAAIVAVCSGVVGPPRFPELSVPVEGADPHAQVARSLAHVPIWLFHGTKDESIPVGESQTLHAAFLQAGAASRFTEYPDEAHAVWVPAFDDPALWTWLFEQRRARP